MRLLRAALASHRRLLRSWIPWLLVAGLLGPGCSGAPAESGATASEAPPPSSGKLFALLLNGGERKAVNYRSHLQHLRELVGLLEASGVPAERITAFASDGPDPAPDLAVREGEPPRDFWLLPRSGVAEHLRPPITYVSSGIEGIPLRPARKADLETWFREEGAKLEGGDTLLLFVTDHGRKNEEDLANNTISLWGESLTVSELQTLLDELRTDVRVVLVMSQCFGGAFARAVFTPEEPRALRGNVCGYFATTADRLAYGCFPESRARDDVGHAHRLFEAWRELARLPDTHRRVLVTDRTPDVPHTTSDFFARRWLAERAAATGRDGSEAVDDLLATAWKRRAEWEPEIRLLDRIAAAFGLFSPRSLAEIEGQTRGLEQLASRLDTYAKRWKDALEALQRENWLRFLRAHPEWRPRFETAALGALDESGRSDLTEHLLADFEPFTRDDRETYERLLSLRRKAEDARQASYRAEVRLGALLRMRTILTTLAAHVAAQEAGQETARAGLDGLRRCEDLRLDLPAPSTSSWEPPEPFPPLEEDRRLIESVMPSWMGIRYRQVSETRRRKLELPRGAAAVITVYPDSPAEAAGIQVGDLILGTPGEPFEEPHAVREWIMRSQLGRPTGLTIWREGRTLDLTLIPGPFPLEIPELPGPPKLGSRAPELEVEVYRGTLAPTPRNRLLFFWATWCGPCKQSLPELVAYASEHAVEVVAITDEEPEELDAFFGGFSEPFPEIVARDPRRQMFQRYGVSGTPTFVRVDEEGIVRFVQRGYRPDQGLRVEGWSYRRSSR